SSSAPPSSPRWTPSGPAGGRLPDALWYLSPRCSTPTGRALDMMLKGRAVVITGGGRGIGREIARLMANQRARAAVNDYGGSSAGLGGATTPAEEVVNGIRQ